MPPLMSSVAARLTFLDARPRDAARLAMVSVPQLAALALMAWSEEGPLRMGAFLCAWGIVNFFWLALLRRPALSGVLSLLVVIVLVVISRFKFQVLYMTASFIDVMIIDSDTLAFLWRVFPRLQLAAIIALLVGVPAAVMIWRLDPFRIRRRSSLMGLMGCLGGLIALSLIVPLPPGEAFGDVNYVSGFARSGVDAVSAFLAHGYIESDPAGSDALRPLRVADACEPSAKRPHILLIHDEGSFDIRDVNGIKVPDGYGPHFLSFDGRERKFLVEGAGGPSWYTEYNVMSGLSSRSFGPFQFFVTRIAAGRVERGLPRALTRCGYRTFAIYPVAGDFLAARTFFTGVGLEHFQDGNDIGGRVFEPDRFYFDLAAKKIAQERGRGPLFLYAYLTANHFPWVRPAHEEPTPEGWRSPGNTPPEVDEYLRRQAVSARAYQEFLARLRREFPDDLFLIVRYGDHQPDFGKLIVDRSIDVAELGRRLLAYDPRYFMTYYAIDAINFQPPNLSSALDVLDAPYLPLVVQEAAGLPLDPSFAEQKKILQRCKGLFYGCNNGAEARRFNRLLIDAGLIKGL